MSELTRGAVGAMDDLPWFHKLTADQRSYVSLVTQTAIQMFADWLQDPSQQPPVAVSSFQVAPRQLASDITLEQTVELIRAAVDYAERAVVEMARPAERARMHEHILKFSREVAFATATAYAGAAERRGAWDARIEAGLVDAIARGHADEALVSRAGLLGWQRGSWVTALATAAGSEPLDIGRLHAIARHHSVSILGGEAGGGLLVLLGGSGDHTEVVQAIADALPPGPIVYGPLVDGLASASTSAAEAIAGLAAIPAWPAAPRPVSAVELLAERAVLGDDNARRRLLEDVYKPLASHGGDLLVTSAAFLEGGSSVEGAGRVLFLHANTVRYRLRKVAELVGYDLSDPRDAMVVRLALMLGRAMPTA